MDGPIDKLYIKMLGFSKEIDWYHHHQQFLFKMTWHFVISAVWASTVFGPRLWQLCSCWCSLADLNHGSAMISDNICFSDRKSHILKTPDLSRILPECESQHESNCNQISDQKPTKVAHGSWLILLLTLYRFSSAVCSYCDNSDWTSFKNSSRSQHPLVFWEAAYILLALIQFDWMPNFVIEPSPESKQ